MNLSKLIARAVWLLIPIQCAAIPSAAPVFPPLLVPWSICLFPILFFAGASFVMNGYPFDVVPLRIWLDKRWGRPIYEDFVFELKPMLFFSVGGSAAAVTEGVRLYLAGAPAAAYARPEFMLSMAIAFFLSRTILARRGLSMESRLAVAPWSGRDFVPAWLQRFKASILSAAIAGVITAAGMDVTTRLSEYLELNQNQQRNLFLVGAIFFLFLPVAILVLGVQNLGNSNVPSSSRNQMASVLKTWARIPFWMLGAAAYFLAMAAARALAAHFG